MIVTIKNVNSKPFILDRSINNKDGKLKIGVKHIGFWLGLFNVSEDSICQFGNTNFTIKAGLYTFKEISTVLKQNVDGLQISIDKTSGVVNM